MMRTCLTSRKWVPAFAAIALSLSLAAFPWLTPCRADEPAEPIKPAVAPNPEPTTRPAVLIQQDVPGPDGSIMHIVTPATLPSTPATTEPATQPATGQPATTAPATGPVALATTEPATQPAVAIAEAARPELDAIRDAYKALTSLHLAGNITGEFDINGQQMVRHGSVLADFEARPEGAPRFRQTTHDDEAAKPGKPADEDAIAGSTGEKLYLLDPLMKEFQSTDAPKKKFEAGKMPRPYYDLLSDQDPSLLLALVQDPTAEILNGLTSVEKVDDVKIGDDVCPTLRLVDNSGDSTDLVIDPKKHLLRRSISDLRELYKKQGQPEVKKVLITIDYTDVSPGTSVKEELFAFVPPEGAREIPGVAEVGPQLPGGPGEASPANALEGKAAPVFILKDMKDKDVSLADMKGSVVVLDFWATWCGPCRESLPHLNKLYEDKRGNGLKVYALDLKEDKDDVQQGIKELKLTLPVLLDADGKVANKYLVTGIPQTVVIGKDGTVKKVFVGSGSHDQVRKAVEEAMK